MKAQKKARLTEKTANDKKDCDHFCHWTELLYFKLLKITTANFSPNILSSVSVICNSVDFELCYCKENMHTLTRTQPCKITQYFSENKNGKLS